MRAKDKPLNINYTGLGGKILALSLLLFAIGIVSVRAATVLWSEGFEGYKKDAGQTYGSLDKNVAGGANAAANGVGNPWFGPNPNNAWVTEAMDNPLPIQETITPHSGTNMIRGSRSDTSGWSSGSDNDIDHVNLAYRFHGGAPLKSNFSIDWWFYDECGNTYPADDMDAGPANFGDHAGIEYSLRAPANTDYANNGSIGTPGENPYGLNGDEYLVTARLAIGACQPNSGGCSLTNYQVQVQGATDAGTIGIATEEYGTGWFNTTFMRTNGWRHAAITVDANNMAVFSIDDTVVLKHATGATNGFNVFTTTELQPTLGTYNQSAYYDDITLSLLSAPKITSFSISSQTNLVINATDGVLGWTYNALMGTNAAQPLSQWTPISTNLLTANGPFSLIATNGVSAASARRFFALRCGIQP